MDSEYPDSPGTGLFALLNPLLAHSRFVIGFTATVTIVTIAISFAMPSYFRSRTAFAPESGETATLPASLQGLGSLAGMYLGGGSPGSPYFYSAVLMSDGILDQVLQSRFTDRNLPGDTERSLLDILDIPAEELPARLEKGRRKMRNLCGTSIDKQTNIATFSCEARDPLLAYEVTHRFMDLLDDFNARTRMSSARQRRIFTENRLEVVREELATAEEALGEFMIANTRWDQSPVLQLEKARLQRTVDTSAQLYMSLIDEYERARIQEANDIPVITTIYDPSLPTRRSRPSRRAYAVLGLIVGFLLSAAIVYTREYANVLEITGAKEYQVFRNNIGTLLKR